MKNLYRGAFNYGRFVKVEYAYASSEKQARVVFCNRLAKKDGVHPSVLMDLFAAGRDNYEIKIETEFTEEQNG